MDNVSTKFFKTEIKKLLMSSHYLYLHIANIGGAKKDI